MYLLNHLGLLWWLVEGKTIEVGKNVSKEGTGEMESAFADNLSMMQLQLFSFSEEKSDPQRAKCLEFHS